MLLLSRLSLANVAIARVNERLSPTAAWLNSLGLTKGLPHVEFALGKIIPVGFVSETEVAGQFKLRNFVLLVSVIEEITQWIGEAVLTPQVALDLVSKHEGVLEFILREVFLEVEALGRRIVLIDL